MSFDKYTITIGVLAAYTIYDALYRQMQLLKDMIARDEADGRYPDPLVRELGQVEDALFALLDEGFVDRRFSESPD